MSEVVRVEVRGDTAIATLLVGPCGAKRQTQMVLPEGQTPEEQAVTLKRMYPNAEIEVVTVG